MDFFRINEVYEFIESNKLERILWISGDYKYMYTIELNVDKLVAYYRQINDFQNKFDNGVISYYCDSNISSFIEGEKISEKSRKLLENSWNIIKYVTDEKNIPNIYDERLRGKILKDAIEKFGVSKATIYKYLRKYWQGGKIKIALLPELYKCGGKGKEKCLGDKKVGRKNYISYIYPEKLGINLDECHKEIIREALKKFYNNHKELSLMQAYNLMKSEYYTELYKDEDGNTIKRMLPAHKIPTYSQFKYRYYKEKDIKNEIENRKSKKEYQLNHAPITSNAKYHSLGPGYIYEIDSTISPIYLVNRINHKGIGRPVVYYVIDVFSCMITGVFVGAGYANYEGAATALYNCTEDKVEFCKRYGLNISQGDWPNSGLPMSLRADRGELVDKLPEKIIENLSVAIETTASYMGKMKGTVEKNFNIQERALKPYLDGIIESDFRKRGGTDARKSANMDIKEFTKAVLRAVIYHNKHIMKNYPVLQGMVDDNIVPSANEIWKWGITHISGNLRDFPDEYIKLNLLRSGKAMVTERGIRFSNRYYRCNKINIEEWYIKAKNHGYRSINVRFDPRNLDNIYMINEEDNNFEICYMKVEESIFFDRSYDEMQQYVIDKKIDQQTLRDIENQNEIELHQGLTEDIKVIRKKFTNTNKKILKSDIKLNKKLENEAYGKTQAINLCRDKVDNTEYNNNNSSGVTETRKKLFDRILNVKKE